MKIEINDLRFTYPTGLEALQGISLTIESGEQVAIVGFGKPAQRVVVVDGGIRVATTVHGSLAADHRASDGARGALFLAEINRLLQQPHEL